MHRTLFGLAAIIAFGCSRPSASVPLSDVPLVEPKEFALWPSVTEEPIEVGPTPWRLCKGPTPEQERARKADEEANGPHARYSIIVRISPNAEEAFRSGATLPFGRVVVKEKHRDRNESGSFDAYALMIKHEAGYDAANGDWEYAYVTLTPERTVTRGRLKECSQCHAKASDRDSLFRFYLAVGN